MLYVSRGRLRGCKLLVGVLLGGRGNLFSYVVVLIVLVKETFCLVVLPSVPYCTEIVMPDV